MTHVEHELKSQPECWIRAAEQAKAHDGALPEVGERVAIVGLRDLLLHGAGRRRPA